MDTLALMTSCQSLIQRLLRQSVECVFSADNDLWPVAVQPEQLEAALLNLVANARDAMPAGGRARIATRNVPKGAPLSHGLPPGDYVCFSVEDTGLGMAPEVLAKATEAFFTTKPADRGTGLGLAMVDAFATEAGGALDIHSELGRGTKVDILLPRAPRRPRPLDAADQRYSILERIRRRVRTPWLIDVLDAWSKVSGAGGLPRPESLESVLIDHSSCSLVLAVDGAVEPFELRLVRLGQRLVELLERSAVQHMALNGPEVFGSLATTYRRALRSRCPNYQFARHCFGHGSHTEIERLVLPAAVDDPTVSHLFGVVLITSDDTEGEHEHRDEHRGALDDGRNAAGADR